MHSTDAANLHYSALPDCPRNLPAEFPLRMVHRLRQAPIEAHTHEFTELVVVLDGHAEHCFEGESFPISAGTVFLVPPGRRHGYSNIKGLVLSNLCFNVSPLLDYTGEILAGMADVNNLFRQGAEPDQAVAQRGFYLDPLLHLRATGILDLIYAELIERRQDYLRAVVIYVAELLLHLGRCFKTFAKYSGPIHSRLAVALGYIEANYASTLTLDQIAEYSGFSKSGINALFRRHTGMPPIDYLIRIRLEKAACLLSDPFLSITQIAFSVGFNDSNYFTRQFKKKYKCSPRQYRDKLAIA